MQNKLTEGLLLNEKGYLNEAGYATSLVKKYSRDQIKASKLRIKEWDYYLIHNENYAVALTIADNGYMGLLSASFIDFTKPKEKTTSVMTLLPKGKFELPNTSKEGSVEIKHKKIYIEFFNNGEKRVLNLTFKKFDKNKTFKCHFILTKEPEDSMVIATPFPKKKTAFYYNQKIIGMQAKGWAEIGDQKIEFEEANALLDWGRGVWTYKNTWYWGAGMGNIDGNKFGFNIGYGFGDTSNASENMLFFNGKAHKLDQVTFNIPKTKKGKDDFLKPWTFTSNDNRFEMEFTPIINRKSFTSALVISSDQNHVFGRFNGTAVLDDGTKIVIKNFLGFAEKVKNKW